MVEVGRLGHGPAIDDVAPSSPGDEDRTTSVRRVRFASASREQRGERGTTRQGQDAGLATILSGLFPPRHGVRDFGTFPVRAYAIVPV
mgnify:CR=1 FL=1